MTQSICNCNCGTRIVLDEQLLEEREMWKQKYYCLQKQSAKDIGLMKERIYQQCSTLMQTQFNKKEKQHNQMINVKAQQIQNLTSRIIKLETTLKIQQKENQVLKVKVLEEQTINRERLEEITNLKQRNTKLNHEWEEKLINQISNLRTTIKAQHDEQIVKLNSENQHLRHKIKQFEKKYQLIIPQVEKLKNLLASKTSQLQGLEVQYEKLKSTKQKQISELKQKGAQSTKNHEGCYDKISRLNQKVHDLQGQLQRSKSIKRQVKIQPVYIDRPVQVQRVIQRIVQVERIVKEYIQPENNVRQLQNQNKKLAQQLANIIRELHLFQDKYEETISHYETTIGNYEQNIQKYKGQRTDLVNKIQEQNKQLDSIYVSLQNRNRNSDDCSGNPQKIVVHVNKDGTYQKRVQKIDINTKVSINNDTINNLQKNTNVQRQKGNQKSTKSMLKKR